MTQNNQEFSRADLMKLLQQPQTQALIKRLQQLDSSAIHQAAAAASMGNSERAKELLTPLLEDEEVKKLTSQMRDPNG